MSDHKSVAICDIQFDSGLSGKANAEVSSKTLWSVEEALASRVNSWENWLCAAGTENLHISADGNLFSATCRVGGYLGNVFEGQMSLPEKWITCTKKWCMCGADMQIRKTKDPRLVSMARNPLPKDAEAESLGDATKRVNAALSANLVVPAQHEAHAAFPKSITWDLSRRCNYACSYCHPSVSNQFDSHHSQKTLLEAVDRLERRFCRGEKAKWVFTGGEPTINPAFMDVVDRINSYGHTIHVQSNGSRGPAYFRELIAKACVGLSLHLEADATERFFETCAAVIDEKDKNETASRMWFGVRIMVGPGRVAEAIAIKRRLNEIPGFSKWAHINLSPLYKRLKQDELMEYAEEEFRQLLQHA